MFASQSENGGVSPHSIAIFSRYSAGIDQLNFRLP